MAIRYKEHVGRLIDRLRKGGPAEFDPASTLQPQPTSPLPSPGPTSADAIEHLRTSAVRKWEDQLRALPLVKDELDPAKRALILLTVASKVVLISQYERAEASIYASQVELLSYLNAKPTGESADRLRQLFYDPACIRFPEIFRSYPFEGYLGFLQASTLIAINNLVVTITDEGREYLIWRVEQKRPPRLNG